MERQSDECWNKEEKQHEGHRGSGSQSQVEIGRPSGKNGLAQMGTRYVSVRPKYWQEENWVIEDQMRRHVQESNRTVVKSSQKPDRIEYL